MSKGLLSLMTLVLLSGAAGHAQQSAPTRPQPSATFRSNINLVEVHAVVTDARGQFVEGLTREDFEIYEDGRLQPTAFFEAMHATPAPRPARALELPEPDVRASARRFNGRLFVIVLDDLHTTTFRTPQVRQAARRFLDRHLAAGDLAAVVYTSGRQDLAQELTSSHRLLRASIDKFQGQKLPSASAERLAVHMREREQDAAAADAGGEGSSSSRTRQPGAQVEDPFDAERGMQARRALDLIRDVAQWMSDVQGRRKALVLFSEGIDYDIYDVFNNKSASSIIYDARAAIAAAQRANVAIYAVDPRGLTQLGDEQIAIASLSNDTSVDYGTSRGFQRELLLAQESLMWLAEDTGGLALVRSNDLDGGLRRIDEDNSRYYMLGYVTDPARGPDKFRRIEVKVKREAVKVRARRGYLPPDTRALARKREAEVKAGTPPALAAAINNPLPVGEIPVRVFATALKGAEKNASVLLAIEMDAATLPYAEEDGRFTNKVEVSIVAADHTGKVRGSDRKELSLKLKPETRERLAHGGVRFLHRLDLPPARYQLRVGVHESVGGTLATVPYDLEVPDFSKTAFALSGLVVTSTSAATHMTPEPDPQLKEIFPVPPVATRTFTRGDMIGVFAELVDNSTPAAHVVDVTATVRPAGDVQSVFSRQEAITVEAGRGARTLAYKAEVPLRDLTPGDYVLRLEATSRLDERTTMWREVPFTIAETPRTTSF